MKKYVFLTAVLCVCLPGLAMASAIPNVLAWQGVALDESDAPLATGVYSFRFAIYDEPVAGNLIWEETQSVHVTNGLVNILLGSVVPLPETAFDGPLRFLEVQFESEDPYAPRTQLVSVGYAFRVATIDGAIGGTLTNGSSSIAAIQSSAEGGLLELLDDAGNTAVSAGADADGDGGSAYVFSDAAGSNGISLDGNSAGSGDPAVGLVGSASAVAINGGLSGDDAVMLPVDAVDAVEMKNESGVAVGARGGMVLDIGTDYVSLAVTSATFPTDGYALVVAETTFRSHGVDRWIDGLLLEDGSPVETWSWDPGDQDPYFDGNQIHLYAAAVTAGTHSYELQVKQNKDNVDAEGSRVMIFFYPTAYGVVASPTATLDAMNPDGSQNEPALATPLDPVGERNAAVSADQERITSELAAMKTQMEKLEAELREAKAWIEQERK